MRWRSGFLAPRPSGSGQLKPLVQIENATFYRRFPSQNERDAPNPPLFPSLSFAFRPVPTKHWAVIAPSNHGKTTFFDILRGKHICVPPNARSYPFLNSPWIDQAYRDPARAIQHVGFDGESGNAKKSGTRGAYLSARYESRREDSDFTLRDYMLGKTELNALIEKEGVTVKESFLQEVVADFRLEPLMDMPMSNLSNGQTRRARIAKAILGQPMVLLLDEPFMGLDPPTIQDLSKVLFKLSAAGAPSLIISLRPQDQCPSWMTNIIRMEQPLEVTDMRKLSEQDQFRLSRLRPSTTTMRSALADQATKDDALYLSRDGLSMRSRGRSPNSGGEILMSMQGVIIKYGEKTALGDWESKRSLPGSSPSGRGMWWEIRRGQRWGVFGSNGSGKTTLISLICSDHPQAYSQPLEIFGRSRLPKLGSPGISIFDIQSRIGQSSPEIHAFFPKHLSLRQTLMSAWAETFLGPPEMTEAGHANVDAVLRWFKSELNPPSSHGVSNSGSVKAPGPQESVKWADEIAFGQSPFSVQRVALFLRAIIRKSDLVVLDEAFSGMDAAVRDKCMLFLAHGERLKMVEASNTGQSGRFVRPPKEPSQNRPQITGLTDEQALICISHVREEVPGVVRHWVRLPEPNSGQGPQFGSLTRPLEADARQWNTIWGLHT